MLAKIARFGAVFTVLYAISLLVANAVLGTEYELSLYPLLTADTFILAVIAGAIAWLVLADKYEAKYSFGEGLIGQLLTALLIGFIVALVSSILGMIVYALFSGILTNTIWFAIYMLVQIPLNGLAICWLAEER